MYEWQRTRDVFAHVSVRILDPVAGYSHGSASVAGGRFWATPFLLRGYGVVGVVGVAVGGCGDWALALKPS